MPNEPSVPQSEPVVPVAIVSLPPAAATAVKTAEKTQPQELLPSKPAETTFQQDLTLAGQRNINIMWEGTQRNIALLVTGVTLLVLGYLVVAPGATTELKLVALSTLSNVLFAVVSVYFTRTNHTKTGGVSEKDTGR